MSMTPDEEQRLLERLLDHMDRATAACERAREFILDRLRALDVAEVAGHPDPIGDLMEREGIGFIDAVERLAAERGAP